MCDEIREILRETFMSGAAILDVSDADYLTQQEEKLMTHIREKH